ncbi:MAG: 30S ribosomal protein S13 [Candidatus Kapaibacterium sp.]|jgi:small subunit ribosomal protein S13
MARIAGIDLPRNKRGVISLTYIFGIGKTAAQEVLAKAGVDESKRVQTWTDEEIARIRTAVSEYKVEGQLRSEIQLNIKRLMDIGAYRGLRHRKGLPVRGQRTRTNSRTRKGRRKTVAGKKKAARK